VGIAEDLLGALHLEGLSTLIDAPWRRPSHQNLLPGHVDAAWNGSG
jgi:hypothetical protein